MSGYTTAEAVLMREKYQNVIVENGKRISAMEQDRDAMKKQVAELFDSHAAELDSGARWKATVLNERIQAYERAIEQTNAARRF